MGSAATSVPQHVLRRRPAWVVVCVAAMLLGVLAVILAGRSSTTNSALHRPHLTMRTVDATDAQTDVDALAGPGRLSVLHTDSPSHQQVVLGQLTYDNTARAVHGGQYALFVIDNDSHTVAPLMWGVGPRGTDVGQGWDGRFDTLARTYSWLRPLAGIRNAGGDSTDPGTAVVFPPGTSAPITFAAYLPADALPISRPAQQLTIAVAYIDDAGRPGSVQRLTP